MCFQVARLQVSLYFYYFFRLIPKCHVPTAILVCYMRQKILDTDEDDVRSVKFSRRVNLLAKGTEGVAEGFGCQMEQSLQEHVDLQGVEALPFIWRERDEREGKRTKVRTV